MCDTSALVELLLLELYFKITYDIELQDIINAQFEWEYTFGIS